MKPSDGCTLLLHFHSVREFAKVQERDNNFTNPIDCWSGKGMSSKSLEFLLRTHCYYHLLCLYSLFNGIDGVPNERKVKKSFSSHHIRVESIKGQMIATNRLCFVFRCRSHSKSDSTWYQEKMRAVCLEGRWLVFMNWKHRRRLRETFCENNYTLRKFMKPTS